MPLSRECGEWEKNRLTAEETAQQEILPEDKNLSETIAEKNEIKKLEAEGKIDPTQKKRLEQIRNYVYNLFRDKPDRQRDLFKLEEKEILHGISIGEKMRLLEIEMDPNSHTPDDDDDIITALSKFLKKTKNSISQLFSSKKELNKNSDRS